MFPKKFTDDVANAARSIFITAIIAAVIGFGCAAFAVFHLIMMAYKHFFL